MKDEIRVLDEITIDKIAAGEVVERPFNVVKELVENSIDALASAITVEIKEGGTTLIRVTDNGKGIRKDQLERAFLRHATSKIRSANDLQQISSLGFRGEALSSISAVSQVEVITKPVDEMIGARLLIDGGVVKSLEEVGAPSGSTFLIKNLFYNVPARKKFLKKSATEGSYIVELMEHLALSRPDVSFKVIHNRQEKFHTYGNGNLEEVIYKIYGKEVAAQLIKLNISEENISISGYIGKPAISRGNRNFQHYFMNGRYIRSSMLAKGVEEGYGNRLMKHQFPFVVLQISLPFEEVDVNVHPTKLEVRFHKEQDIYKLVVESVDKVLSKTTLIPPIKLVDEKTEVSTQHIVSKLPEPFEENRKRSFIVEETTIADVFGENTTKMQDAVQKPIKNYDTHVIKQGTLCKDERFFAINEMENCENMSNNAQQTSFLEAFEEETSILGDYNILGQVFDTYWLIKTKEQLYMLDQHAAHEKIMYENMIKRIRTKTNCSQAILPPIVLSLSTKEENLLLEYLDVFISLGFDIEEFGGKEYALRGIPVDLYGCQETKLLYSILDELEEIKKTKIFTAMEEKLASMSCKAAIKGSSVISLQEASVLIEDLLKLDNPFHCPHGRPTIVSMSKTEMEKKFKRIV